MAVPQEKGWRRGACELAALGLWALAFNALLSLVSHDARCDPNFGGALGDGLTRNPGTDLWLSGLCLGPVTGVPGTGCLGRNLHTFAAAVHRGRGDFAGGAQHSGRSLQHPDGVAGRCHRAP
jgi:hypothetical protein